MFTKANIVAVTVITVAFAAPGVSFARGADSLSQQAIDFQMNQEISRPASTMPAVTLPADAHASTVAPKRIERRAPVANQQRDFQLEAR
jgi:hypothetical protein